MSGDKRFTCSRSFLYHFQAPFLPRITRDIFSKNYTGRFTRNYTRRFFQEFEATFFPRNTRGVASKNCTRRCFQELHATLLPRITRGVASKNCTRRCFQEFDAALLLHSYIIILYVYNYKILCTDNDIRFILRVPLRDDKVSSNGWFQLSTNFYLDKKDEIYHHSSKEHSKINKIAKFGCEMALWN